MKKLSLLFLLLLTGCSADKVEETAVEESVVVEESVIEEVEESVVEESVVEEVLDRQARISLALATLEGNFEGTGIIDYDEKNDAIRLIPTNPALTMEIYQMFTGELGTEDWDRMVESFREMSESLSGLVDEDIYFSLVNPENEDNTLLLLQDGFIIYNLRDDL